METVRQSRAEAGMRTGWLTGWTLDAIVAVLSLLMITGVAIDFRAHASGISFAEEGFLTPEHTFFYSMFLAIAAVIGLATYRERRDGADWIDAVPTGYGWGVIGVIVFGLGGFGDFLWHSAFGFEESFDALVSPSHLMLALGGSLFLASPLRASWYRERPVVGIRTLPALVGAALVMTNVALFSAYVNPLVERYAAHAGEMNMVLGVTSLLVFPVVLVGGALALTRGFDLPPGAVTFVFAVVGLASATVRGTFAFVVPVVVAGIVADAIVQWRRPGLENRRALRLFGAVVPAVFVTGYLAVVQATTGTPWVVHVWSGAPILAALAGLLLTYAIAPGPER